MPRSFDYLMALDLESDLKKSVAGQQHYIPESDYIKIESFIID
jgi:hypothetical protein